MQPKTFLTLQIFQPTFFCLVSEKTFALHHLLTPKNCILETLWKKISVYFCICLSENFCSWDAVRFYLVWRGRMISLRTTRCLSLIKCFTIFHFNWHFRKLNHFKHFDSSIYSIKTLKFSRQFGLVVKFLIKSHFLSV